ncbi:chromatin modification-related protein EAF1 B-like [Punica granatum]|uniref:Chromatin modification-related protein EAF1 B-like n=1 Tax=Punica granatum TaxID=22663 RepID=A0A6P8EEG4_PUNGR|nr:chromatin modification-related protein EAF1 B-like [Punica granatum]
MGGVVDGGVGIGIKTSPRRAAIEKAQAELRQEYDVREERRRELEFLEKGGNPLDFKFANVASLSVQSTSLANRHPEQFHSSEAKASFALAASPHGDSVESSGRPGPPSISGRKSTDNPVLFDGENELLDGEKNSLHLGKKNNITSSEQSSQMDGNRNAKELEDSANLRPYARRYRTRTNRDGARLGSADGVHNRGGHGSSLASRANIKDAKGSSTETNSQKEKPKLVGINGDMISRTATPESRLDGQIDGEQALVSISSLKQSGLPTDKLDISTKGSKDNNRHKQPSSNRKPPDLACQGPDLVPSGEGTVSVGNDDLPPLTKEKEIDTIGKLNGSSDFKGDGTTVGNEVQKSCEARDRKGSESSIHPSIGMDAKKVSICNDAVKINSNGNSVVQPSESETNEKLAGDELIEQEDINKIVDSTIVASNENHSPQQIEAVNGAVCEGDEETNGRPDLQIKANDASGASEDEHGAQMGTENEREEKNMDCNSNLDRDNLCNSRPPVDLSSCEAPSTSLSGMECDAPPDRQTPGNNLSTVDKAYEDSVLEEARIIQAKHKRIAELSRQASRAEIPQRCHWNFVLEEMAWLANDFAQERIWKMTAAAQLCHRIASFSRYRCEEQSQRGKLKVVAHNLAKAVMQFWHSAEMLINGENSNPGLETRRSESEGAQMTNGDEVSDGKTEDPDMESSKTSMLQIPGRRTPIQAYAVQYLRDNNPHVYPSQVEAPKTPDIVSDVDMPEVSWDDHLTEESLFYTVPSGAMEAYRKSIEAYVTECERTGSNVQEEVGTSIFGTVADQGYQDNAYDEDEAETSAYYLPGTAEGSKSLKFAQKKRKNPKFYEQGADLPYGHYTPVTQPSTFVEKRPANLSVGPIPAKRMRTANASRQRVLSPLGTGAHSGIQAQAKTEVSSGDTNSFHDDQSSLHGGSRIQKGVEVESAGDFDKHMSYDYAETSTKPKKKKKTKHPDSTFEPGWQMGSTALGEQREQSKKRSEHFESNGTSGLYAQHNAKKPKTMKQSQDNTYDNIMSMNGSMPCPMGSQVSNMSNQNKMIRYIGGRDRSRKAKALKASSLHSGPGSPWSLFEDQALVVLVHDMGPNWELVSDAINSTLQFKCIFRKPKECKERHKFLMDKTAGDGADSAEDSGSSQSYPSTLPGIPKGSARQLFQRLQGPVEEDTLKEHFDKIIHITRQHHRRIQLKTENQDLKQIPVHNSHFVALSQVCPNNLNGVVLTPLDLIEATASGPDVLPLGYQGSHATNLAMPNQGGAVSSVLAASGVNSTLPVSSGFALGNNMSPSGSFNAPTRDGRYNAPKTSSSPGDEQHRMQPYNQMLSNRTIPQSNLSIPGAVPGSDRGVRVLPGGNGLGVNRTTVPMARPGFPGMASSPMLSSSAMLSSPMVGSQSTVNMHAGSGPTQGRAREVMHMARGGHNMEQQRQMPSQDLPMHVTQGNAQGVSPFNGISPAFSNQTTSPVQTYPGHSQQQQHQMSSPQPHAPNNPHHHPQLQGSNHSTGPQQQQMYLRLAKERQLQQQQQQRFLQQQQFSASNNLMSPVQSPPQLPMSSPLQNSPQIQSQPLTAASLPPLTQSSPMTPIASQQHPQKNQLPPHSHGLPRNPQTTVGGLNNQVGPKQRQRQAQQQQFQQSGRAHPQQRPQAQPHQQQAKYLKGIGRGNMFHQKAPVDPSHLNGLSVAPGSMGAEKEMMQQGQGLYPGVGINQVQPSKAPIPQAPHHSQLPSSPAAPHSAKQHPQQQVPSHSENSVSGQFSAGPPGHNTSSAPHQAVPSTLLNPHIGQLQPQPQPQPNQINQSHTVAQRMHPQNRQHMNYEQLQVKSQHDKAQAADQKLVNSAASQAGVGSAATTAVAGSVDSASKAARAASPPVHPQRKPSEAGIPSTSSQVGPIGSPTVPSSVRSEQLPSLTQGGIGQRHLAENLPHHGHGGGGAHGSLAKQSSGPLPPPSQQHYLPQSQEQREQPLPQQQSQQPQPQSQPPQNQHLQAAQGSLYIGPTNT